MGMIKLCSSKREGYCYTVLHFSHYTNQLMPINYHKIPSNHDGWHDSLNAALILQEIWGGRLFTNC